MDKRIFDYGYITDFTVDYKRGDFFVYMFVDGNGEIYYVGMGGYARITTRSNRNSDFKNHYEHNNSKIVVLAMNCTEADAQNIELFAIWTCQLDGFELTNIKDMLTNKELRDLRFSVKYSQDSELKELMYGKFLEKYKDVQKSIESLEKWLHSGGMMWESDFINIDDTRTKAKECWTIDGVTKKSVEWCNQYNIVLATVKRRMALGCTPKEALTFPHAPASKRGCLQKWWRENGYIPGTDHSSYVTPLNEWPSCYKMDV